MVVGAPPTPTPRGPLLDHPRLAGRASEFLGSWILGVTAHSDVLRSFEGGGGEVAIHGRAPPACSIRLAARRVMAASASPTARSIGSFERWGPVRFPVFRFGSRERIATRGRWYSRSECNAMARP